MPAALTTGVTKGKGRRASVRHSNRLGKRPRVRVGRGPQLGLALIGCSFGVNRYGTGVLEGTYMRRYEAPLRSRIDPEANCACPDAR